MWANYSDLSSLEDEFVEPLILNRIRRPKDIDPLADYFLQLSEENEGIQNVRLERIHRTHSSVDDQSESEEPVLDCRIPPTTDHQTSNDQGESSSETILMDCRRRNRSYYYFNFGPRVTRKASGKRPSSERKIQRTTNVSDPSLPAKEPMITMNPQSRFFPDHEALEYEDPIWMQRSQERQEHSEQQRAATQSTIQSLPEKVSKGKELENLPEKKSKGKEPENLPEKKSKGKEPENLPGKKSKGKEPENLPEKKSKGKEPENLLEKKSKGKEPEKKSKGKDPENLPERRKQRATQSTSQSLPENLPERRMPRNTPNFFDKILSSMKNKFQGTTTTANSSRRRSLSTARPGPGPGPSPGRGREEPLLGWRLLGTTTTHSCERALLDMSEPLRWCCASSDLIINRGESSELLVDIVGRGKLRAYVFEIIRSRSGPLSNMKFRVQFSPGGYFRITKAQRMFTAGLIFGWLVSNVSPFYRTPVPRPPVPRELPVPSPPVASCPKSEVPRVLTHAPVRLKVPDHVPFGVDVREEDDRMSSLKGWKRFDVWSVSSSAASSRCDSPQTLPVSTSYIDYEEIDIQVDSMSLFRALVHGENIAKETGLSPKIRNEVATEYRKRVVNKLCEDEKSIFLKRFIEDDFEEYVKRMGVEENYGGEVELSVACEVVQAPVRVYMEDENIGGLILIAEYGSTLLGNSNNTFVNILYKGADYRPKPPPPPAAAKEIVKTS